MSCLKKGWRLQVCGKTTAASGGTKRIGQSVQTKREAVRCSKTGNAHCLRVFHNQKSQVLQGIAYDITGSFKVHDLQIGLQFTNSNHNSRVEDEELRRMDALISRKSVSFLQSCKVQTCKRSVAAYLLQDAGPFFRHRNIVVRR